MKKSFPFLILISCHLLSGQILCIKCYDQNDSISYGVHNLLLNGGFEKTTCALFGIDYFCPNSIDYKCNIVNWKCTGGGMLTYASIYDSTLSIIPEGKNAVY